MNSRMDAGLPARVARQLGACAALLAALLPACQSPGGADTFYGAFAGPQYGSPYDASGGLWNRIPPEELPGAWFPAQARTQDPTVLACTLDGRPDQLVITLGDGLCLAYDTASCTLAKAWRGDVEVGDPAEASPPGPLQATSRGEALADPLAGSTWMLAPDRAAGVSFIGYSFTAGHVTLQWDVREPGDAGLDAAHPPLSQVLETPEVTRDDAGNLVLLRLFEVTAPDAQKLLLQNESCTTEAIIHAQLDSSSYGDSGGADLGWTDSDTGLGFALQVSEGRALLKKNYEKLKPS